MNSLQMKMNSLQLKMNEVGADAIKNFPDDKIPDVLSFLQNMFVLFINWVDDVFPPGTRMETLKHCIYVAAPYAILAILVLLCVPCIWFLFLFCFRLLMGILGCLSGILCCCCRGGVRMMKAPGRNVRIPRPKFQANPAAYFRGLRANQPISPYFLA